MSLFDSPQSNPRGLTREQILNDIATNFVPLYNTYNQQHVLTNYEQLDGKRLLHLYNSITSFSLPFLQQTFTKVTANNNNTTQQDDDFAPYNSGGLDLSQIFDIESYQHCLPQSTAIPEDLTQGLKLGEQKQKFTQLLAQQQIASTNPGLLTIDPTTYIPSGADVNVIAPPSINDTYFYYHIAMQAILKNQLGVVILAGGQGTRLGFDKPKAVFTIDTPSECTLLLRLIHSRHLVLQLAKHYYATYYIQQQQNVEHTLISNISIPLIILTSSATEKFIRDYMDELHLQARNGEATSPTTGGITLEMLQDVFYVQQSSLPAVETATGKVFVADDYIQMSPNGNGGVYAALFPLLDRFRSENATCKKDVESCKQKCYDLKNLMLFNIDNICGKVCCPLTIGYTIYTNADVAVKCVPKVDPNEKVGVLGLKNGRFSIVEYSEIADRATQRDATTGKLKYIDGNTNTIIYKVDFLFKWRGLLTEASTSTTTTTTTISTSNINTDGCTDVKVSNDDMVQTFPLHRADKKVKMLPNPIRSNQQQNQPQQGQQPPQLTDVVKFELFAFDCFPMAEKLKVIRVNRFNHFLPVKNANHINHPHVITPDSPAYCIQKSHCTSTTALLHSGYCVLDVNGRVIVDDCRCEKNVFIDKDNKYKTQQQEEQQQYQNCLGFVMDKATQYATQQYISEHPDVEQVCLCQAAWGLGIELDISQFYVLSFPVISKNQQQQQEKEEKEEQTQKLTKLIQLSNDVGYIVKSDGSAQSVPCKVNGSKL